MSIDGIVYTDIRTNHSTWQIDHDSCNRPTRMVDWSAGPHNTRVDLRAEVRRGLQAMDKVKYANETNGTRPLRRVSSPFVRV